MYPSSLTDVLLFLLIVTPGVGFELLWQRTRPRRDESAFIEAGRVLLAGVVLTGLALACLLLVDALSTGVVVDFARLAGEGDGYVAGHRALAMFTTGVTVVLALLFAVGVNALLTSPTARRLAHETVWHSLLVRQVPPGVRAFVSVGLRDGTTLTGYQGGFSIDPDPAKRELILVGELSIRGPGKQEPAVLDPAWQRLVVNGADISTIAVSYVGDADAAARPSRRAVTRRLLSRHAVLLAFGSIAVIVVGLLIAGRL